MFGSGRSSHCTFWYESYPFDSLFQNNKINIFLTDSLLAENMALFFTTKRFFSEAVNKMEHRQNWMAVGHLGA